MSDSSVAIANTHLWQTMAAHDDFIPALKGLRSNAEVVAAKIAEVLPEYTDHSITHMDALWSVTQQVFTNEELERFSPGEAFVLAGSFYTHDIGMVLPITQAGRDKLEKSRAFTSAYERATESYKLQKDEARTLALKIAARETHAEEAEKFIDEKLPGLDRYLLESTEMRKKWGAHIGQVAASHHWSLQEVEKRLGSRGRIPDSIGGDLDLGFLACALRVIDYAHINAARAPSLDRLLRSTINAESLKHWNAQENISGPLRGDDHLVFASTRKIEDVDGWWTFYEMAAGLDREVIEVAEYLASRTISAGRFSLKGVKGVRTPQSFASYVTTQGFAPVDIRFHPDSIERLIEILGGRTLYGNDQFAPIRELLQNARDAIHLQQTAGRLINYSGELGEIRVSVNAGPEGGTLSVSDNGAGMSERVITDYLLGIASDYWHSSDFFSDYPGVVSAGFRPAGRFGIGFLSVFMVGTRVEIQTQKRGGSNLHLRLSGVGRRGSLIVQEPGLKGGTTVRVSIERESLGDYDQIDKIVRAKAPMLDVPITVTQQGITTRILPNWWQSCSQDELLDYLRTQASFAKSPIRNYEQSSEQMSFRYRFMSDTEGKWPGDQPEAVSDAFRILAIPSAASVLLCSKGFVIAEERIKGIVGIVDVGEVELNAARNQALQWNRKAFQEELDNKLMPSLRSALDDLSKEQSIPSKYRFLSSVAGTYGIPLLVDTDLPWITVLEPPGETRLVSPNQLLQMVSRNSEVIIVFGKSGNPWDSVRSIRACFPEASNSALIIPVSAGGKDPDIGSYRDRDELIWTDLHSHFKGDEDSYIRSRSYESEYLLQATLKIVASAVNSSDQDLCLRQWARFDQTVCLRVPVK